MENYNVLLLLLKLDQKSGTYYIRWDESCCCTAILAVAVSYLTYRTSSYLKALVHFFGFANRILFFLCVGPFLTQYFISTYIYKKKNTFLIPTFSSRMEWITAYSSPSVFLCSLAFFTLCVVKILDFVLLGKWGKKMGSGRERDRKKG